MSEESRGVVRMPREVLESLVHGDTDKAQLLAAWDYENELRHAAEEELAALKLAASPPAQAQAAALPPAQGWHAEKEKAVETKPGIFVAPESTSVFRKG